MSDRRTEPFLGKWILVPEESEFDQGQPPLAGSCQIGREDDLITFKMEWTDADGTPQQAAFAGRPDGLNVPLDQSGLVESFCLYFSDDGALISEAKRGGEVIMSAKRTITDGGTVLDIEQTVHVPGDGPVTNSSIYRREQ